MCKLSIRAPHLEEERRRVQMIISRLDFYKEHGYDVVLPEKDVEDIFDEESYAAGIRKVEEARGAIEKALERIAEFGKKLDLAPLKEITIVMTKYGVGGSYDIATSRIVVMMKPDGSLQKPAAHLVVHEMLHIATDEHYAKRFTFTHAQNERFIDLLCRDVFGDLLPGYCVQPMGDASADAMLEKYVKEFQKTKSV